MNDPIGAKFKAAMEEAPGKVPVETLLCFSKAGNVVLTQLGNSILFGSPDELMALAHALVDIAQEWESGKLTGEQS